MRSGKNTMIYLDQVAALTSPCHLCPKRVIAFVTAQLKKGVIIRLNWRVERLALH